MLGRVHERGSKNPGVEQKKKQSDKKKKTTGGIIHCFPLARKNRNPLPAYILRRTLDHRTWPYLYISLSWVGWVRLGWVGLVCDFACNYLILRNRNSLMLRSIYVNHTTTTQPAAASYRITWCFSMSLWYDTSLWYNIPVSTTYPRFFIGASDYRGPIHWKTSSDVDFYVGCCRCAAFNTMKKKWNKINGTLHCWHDTIHGRFWSKPTPCRRPGHGSARRATQKCSQFGGVFDTGGRRKTLEPVQTPYACTPGGWPPTTCFTKNNKITKWPGT